jgi:hypothetical protein
VRPVLQKRSAPHTYNVLLGGDVVGWVRKTVTPMGRRCWEADCQAWPRGYAFRSSTRAGAVELLLAAVEAKKVVDGGAGAGSVGPMFNPELLTHTTELGYVRYDGALIATLAHDGWLPITSNAGLAKLVNQAITSCPNNVTAAELRRHIAGLMVQS